MFIDRHYWFRRRGDRPEGRPVGRGSHLGRLAGWGGVWSKLEELRLVGQPYGQEKVEALRSSPKH